MPKLPIKVTERKNVAVVLTFGDGMKAWIYAKEDAHTARINKLPTMEEAKERGAEIARILTDKWSEASE